jgi:hypothetical protein
MKYFAFKRNDVVNQFRTTYPSCSFILNNYRIFYGNASNSKARLSTYINQVPTGSISLFEYNVDRPTDSYIYPYIVKDSSRLRFGSVTTEEFSELDFGDTINGEYNLSASIKRNFYDATRTGKDRPFINALQNPLNDNRKYSKHFAFSSSLGNKSEQIINFVDIPSIFFGSQIKKKSLKLDFYVTGTLVGSLEDNGKGELIQILPRDGNSNKVAGVVLHDYGAIVLTGAWDVTTASVDPYVAASLTDVPFKWYYYLAGALSGENSGSVAYGTRQLESSSFHLHFQGKSDVNTKIMFCTAPRAELNHSTNPTFVNKISYRDLKHEPYSFTETKRVIKNVTSASYLIPTASFEKTTYISKIGIYDKRRNLLGVASVARPVKKTEARDLTFKLKLDI